MNKRLTLPIINVLNPETWQIEPALLLAQNIRYPATFRAKPLSELDPADIHNGGPHCAWWAIDSSMFEHTNQWHILDKLQSLQLSKVCSDNCFKTFWVETNE